MTKHDLSTIQREFDQTRSLIQEHHLTLLEHIKLDDVRQEDVANRLTSQNNIVNSAMTRTDTRWKMIQWAFWPFIGTLISVLAVILNKGM